MLQKWHSAEISGFVELVISQTYVSGSAIGFVLGQEADGIIKPIKFGDRALPNSDLNYSVTDKELLSIYYACKQTEVYIMGHDCVVYTDHKPLVHLKSFRDLVNKRFRWIQYLEELQVKIRYVVGKDNVVADYIRRNTKNELPWSVISCNTIDLSHQLYTNSEFIAFQRQDSELSQIFNFLEKNEEDRDLNGIPTDYRRFIHRISIQDNLLVFNDRGNIIVIMPQNLQEDVLRYSHCDWSSGHFGIFKTHRRVLVRFWWPKLHNYT